MNYNLLFRKYLNIAIEDNCIKDYLLGESGFIVKEDPYSNHTHHAFDYAVLVYNEVNKERPELNLANKYVQALLNELLKEGLKEKSVYSIFRCILAQLRFEKEKRASFILSNEDQMRLLSLLKEKIELIKKKKKKCDYAEGELYSDGLYGYINEKNSEYTDTTGKKLL